MVFRTLACAAASLAALVTLPGSLAWGAAPVAVRVQVVDAKGVPVRDAVVEIDAAGGASAVTFPWRMAMAQKNETFVPGTLVVAKGRTVAFPNLDRVRHSIYSFSKPARFEIELYGRDQTRSHTFPIAGTVALGCNIHDGMRGYLRVVDTPYAGKTDGNGYVTLNGVPAGAATATIWHPRLRAPGGEMRSKMAVSDAASQHRIKVQLR